MLARRKKEQDHETIKRSITTELLDDSIVCDGIPVAG